MWSIWTFPSAALGLRNWATFMEGTAAHALHLPSMHTRTDRDLYTQAIDRLVKYYGSYERSALILSVSTTDLHRWAHGNARPPTDVFLKVLYLNEESRS